MIARFRCPRCDAQVHTEIVVADGLAVDNDQIVQLVAHLQLGLVTQREVADTWGIDTSSCEHEYAIAISPTEIRFLRRIEGRIP